MENLNGWFLLAVLVFLGTLAAVWRFWSPADPLRHGYRRSRFDRLPMGEPLLAEGETIVQRAAASLYQNRAAVQWVAGGGSIAGGGWLAGGRPNKPGFAFVETGTLWLTNRRLVFVGPMTGLTMPLPQILHAAADARWLTLWTSESLPAIRLRLLEPTAWRDELVARVMPARDGAA